MPTFYVYQSHFLKLYSKIVNDAHLCFKLATISFDAIITWYTEDSHMVCFLI